MFQINRAAMDAQMNRQTAKKRNLVFLGISIIFALLATSSGVGAFYGFSIQEILLIGFVAVVNVIFAVLSFAGILTLNRRIDSKAQEDLPAEEKVCEPDSDQNLKLELERDFVATAIHVLTKPGAVFDENAQLDFAVIGDLKNDYLKMFDIYAELGNLGEPKDEIRAIYKFSFFLFNILPFPAVAEITAEVAEDEDWDELIEVNENYWRKKL